MLRASLDVSPCSCIIHACSHVINLCTHPASSTGGGGRLSSSSITALGLSSEPLSTPEGAVAKL